MTRHEWAVDGPRSLTVAETLFAARLAGLDLGPERASLRDVSLRAAPVAAPERVA